MIAVVALVGLTTLGGPASAGLVIDISQVGSNVVTKGIGSIDLTDLTRLGDGAAFPYVEGEMGTVAVGALPFGDFNVFGVVAGPKSFGTGGPFAASSGTGDTFGVEGSGGFVAPVILLPTDYVSGSEIQASGTYLNTTIAGLGLTPGTYSYTWGTGADADSLTINISGVPEPSSLVMAGIAALAGLGLLAQRRRAG
jgi:hypothetical protein